MHFLSCKAMFIGWQVWARGHTTTVDKMLLIWTVVKETVLMLKEESVSAPSCTFFVFWKPAGRQEC